MAYLFCHYRLAANRKNVPFSLTIEEFRKVTSSLCHYCNAAPKNKIKQKRGFGDYTYNGVDRVKNDQGYVTENVVPCCRMCNVAKNNHSLEDFWPG